jgi:hypothetical protein
MPHTEGLTPQSRRILGILRERGNWMTRAELAEALHYNTLSTYHITLLRQMSDKGLIEVRRFRTRDGGLANQYRVKP